MDSSSDKCMMPMEEVPVAIAGDGRGSSSLLEEECDSIRSILVRISELMTGYHLGKGIEGDQVAGIWSDIKKLKEEDHISTKEMVALMSHFCCLLVYFAGHGFQPKSYIDRPFRDYCYDLLREVAAYAGQERELIPIGHPMAIDVHRDISSPIRGTTAEKGMFEKNMFPYSTLISGKTTEGKVIPVYTPLFSKSFPMVAYETNGTGGAATSSGGLIIPYMLKHFVRFIIFAVLSYAALYLLLPDDGGRGITHVVPFWMMAFQVYFMAIIVYSYFHRSE